MTSPVAVSLTFTIIYCNRSLRGGGGDDKVLFSFIPLCTPRLALLLAGWVCLLIGRRERDEKCGRNEISVHCTLYQLDLGGMK